MLDGEDLYWLEGRPAEGGRHVIVKRTPNGQIEDVTPARTNVRTRVHEYGGAAYTVFRGIVYYSEFADQRVYRLNTREAAARTPQPMTPPGERFYADYCVSPTGMRLVCVREDHTEREQEPVNALVTLPLDGTPTAGDVIVSDHDFYATPRFSPDGSQLSWLAWRHPNMPWDGTELWIADVTRAGRLGSPSHLTGGGTDSIFQPGWSPDGSLYFVSDRSGWWNLYRMQGGKAQAVHTMAADFGRPLWQLGASTWACPDAHRLVVAYQERGRWHLAVLDVPSGTLKHVGADLEPGETVASTRTHAVVVGGSSRAPEAILRIDLATGAAETLRTASVLRLDPSYLSAPRPIEFPTEGGLTAHAFYYPPHNPVCAAPAGTRPPLIVVGHGGPTASASTQLNLEVQYWTTRGFGVVDVNYGGSSGYGRAYRRRLDGQWGVVDAADCLNAARSLVSSGEADPDGLIIRGRSAGGYTVLAALTFFPALFQAGASYYGISDLEALARDTHKFESRYLERLIAPYPSRADLYRARSPIHFVDRLSCPLIFFQGLEDRAVPPNQSQLMADALRAQGLPTALLTFEGEQHGFRKAETIVRCLEAELSFYCAVLGLAPPQTVPHLTLENLVRWQSNHLTPGPTDA